MKVFISHKQEDAATASGVWRILQALGAQSYLDLLDPDTASADDLAEHIRLRLSYCDHLIAVVSKLTKLSWWVPWEIGVATERGCALATFALPPCDLPTYLSKWPVLSAFNQLSRYVAAEQNVRRQVLLDAKAASAASSTDYARRFHAELKRQLAQ